MISNPSPESDEFEELMYSHSESFISFVKSVLDSAGIQYIVSNDSHVYLRHLVPSRIFVRKNDFEKARSLLKEFL